MFKINKVKKESIFSALFAFLMGLIVSFTFVSGNTLSTHAAQIGQAVSVEKIYSHATIDEDFDGASVIVVLDKNASGINKRHSVNFFGDIKIARIEDLTQVSNSGSIVDEQNFEQVLLLTLPQDCKETVLHAIERLSHVEGVKYAGPNSYEEMERTPDDPLYTNAVAANGQYGMDKIQAPLAWNIGTGNANVRVGIMDTGIAAHTDLNANLAGGYDFIYAGNPTRVNADIDSHGTHVAGIVGAVGNNVAGVSGVNWNVTLVQMRVGTTGFDSAAVVRGLNWARDNWNTTDRVSIISYSSGTYEERPDYETAIRGYTNVGGLFICSTGNIRQDNDSAGQHHYPSFYASDMHTNPIENMIAVGRSNINDERPATGANMGARTITLFAPGHNIVSTVPLAMCNPSGSGCTARGTHHAHGYHRMSGSSMATPMVTGVAALLLSVNPSLTATQLRAAIVNNIDLPTNAVGNNPLQGLCVTNGRLNAFKALSSILFTASNVSGGISIDGFIDGYTMPNNTNLVLPDRFAPIGTNTQQKVATIGNSAFANQTKITQITIPSSVSTIGDKAFSGCTNLSRVDISLEHSSLEKIGDEAFKGCPNLTAITIPNRVKTIGKEAFLDCYSLANVNIHASNSDLRSIGEKAFSGCETLVSITIPPKVSSIGERAFQHCNNLESIYLCVIEPNAPSLGNNALLNCLSLEVIRVAKNNTINYMQATNWMQYANKFIFADEEVLSLTPSDYGFTSIYLPAEQSALHTFGDISFETKRLRTGYIEQEYVALHPGKFNTGFAYLEYYFTDTIYRYHLIYPY